MNEAGFNWTLIRSFLAALDPSVPVMPVGVGSNLIVRDGGVPGVVVRLPKSFASLAVEPGLRVRAGGAAMGITVASRARDAGQFRGVHRHPAAVYLEDRHQARDGWRLAADLGQRDDDARAQRLEDVGLDVEQQRIPLSGARVGVAMDVELRHGRDAR